MTPMIDTQYSIRISELLTIMMIAALLLSSCADEPQEDIKDFDPEFAFEMVPSAESGITFNNHVEEKYETFFDSYAYVYTGGGVAVGDINNDGLQDVYFTGNEVKDRLYLNKGEMTFEDISDSAITSGQDGWHNGVTILDINGDGWQDIYICRGGWKETPEQRKNLLYINNTDGTFSDQAEQYGIADIGYSMQALFLDIDNDNDLDLYLTNRPDEYYLPLSVMQERAAQGPECCSDRLYLNEGGRYTDISRAAGIVNYGYSLGVVASDLNDDGYIDVYVSNDFSTVDHMYINQGDNTFKDELQQNINHISLYSMGTDVSDINNDGMEDILIMEMRPEDYTRSKVSMPSMDIAGFHAIVDAGMHKQYMHNMLHLNRGNGVFSEVAQYAGIAKTDWSWSGLLGDFDLDGNKDLYVTNGMRRDLFDGDARDRLSEFIDQNKEKYERPEDFFDKGFQGLVETYKPLKLKNYLFKGNEDVTFTNIGKNTSISIPSFSNGGCLADLDNDGDLDIIVNNMEDEAFLLQNTSENSNNSIKINLKGPQNNPIGLGAKVWVHTGDQSSYYQQRIIRGYLSSGDAQMVVGLGDAESIDSVVVIWPDMGRSVQRLPRMNETLTISYSSDLPITRMTEERQHWFVEEDALQPAHIDEENYVYEYEDQILLPHSFTTAGPKMAEADLNGDGILDFYIGGSKSESAALYLSRGDQWRKSDQQAFYLDRIFEDMGSLFFDYDGDGDQDLYVVSGGSDLSIGDMVFQDRLYENQNGTFVKTKHLPEIKSNGSEVVAHDFDGDGDLDLFVGGFAKSNEYPIGDASFFLRNEGGTFVHATADWYDHQHIGIVYEVAMAELDDDDDAEIVIVGEWMPITILDWDGQRFINKTESFGLSDTRGWWTGLDVADIDADGHDDLIVGNLGKNYKFKVDDTHKFEVYANDFDENGTYDIFLATSSQAGHKPVRGLECSSQQMPGLSEKYSTFSSFAKAEIDDILGPEIKEAVNLKADIFSSMILYGDGHGGFTQSVLPAECQYSLINSIIVEDMNGDGLLDMITGGNRFNVEVETTPSDASIGTLLINTGNRSWKTIPATESGIYLKGDIKDMIYTNGKLISSENSGPVRVLQLK